MPRLCQHAAITAKMLVTAAFIEEEVVAMSMNVTYREFLGRVDKDQQNGHRQVLTECRFILTLGLQQQLQRHYQVTTLGKLFTPTCLYHQAV